jgi:hypothetical protein
MNYDDAYVTATEDGMISVTFLGSDGVRTFEYTPEQAEKFVAALRRRPHTQ